MNLPQIQGSIITNKAESHVSAAAIYIDFSLYKVQPHDEYKDIGRSLSARRKNEADEGQSHLTAAQLGMLFDGIVPKVPNLIRVYGLRCSEIANSSTFNPKGTSQHGLFANEVGADGTAIWAAATSGDSAIAVHLLGCMLSRMWDPPEAISIWMQLIAERKHALSTSGNPLEYATSQNITLTREQIASWHTSTQAWRRTADEANARRQNQLLLIINNLGIPVNNKLCLSESVVGAWTTALTTVDKLVAGNPQSVQTGAPLLGLAAWHLYPDMIVFSQGRNAEAKDVIQNDPLIQPGGIMTLGIHDMRRSGDGIYWSLPLTHLRYYGKPVQSEARLSSRTSRASVEDLVYVALGSLIRRWCASASDIELATTFLVQLEAYVDIPGNLRSEGTWLSLLASAAMTFIAAEEGTKASKLQLIKCGRRRYPLFIDDPTADTIFGLSTPSTLLRLLPGNASRISLLRHIARDFSDDRYFMVIQCKSGSSNSLWELASVEQFRSKTKRTHEQSEEECSNSPRRYLRWLNQYHRDLDQHDIQPNSDSIRLETPIPWLWAPHGFQWQNAPRPFYGRILKEEDNHPDWHNAKGATVRSLLAFGDPDVAALYCVSITYWTSLSPNVAPETVPGPQYRQLPNICIIRHVLWALENNLPSKESLFTYLEEGRSSVKILTALRALKSICTLYKGLSNATVELRAAEQPLSKHEWIPQDHQSHRHRPFAAFSLSREEMFACISKFESGSFNFHPSAMHGVLAISSGNSIYVARCLLQDPCGDLSSGAVERVVGNLGKSGMALLVCPAVPEVRSLSDDIRLVNHHPFDGSEEDCFLHTSLHLSYTEWQLPIDVGSRGNRDIEAYYVEAAIGVYDRGNWVADLNILDIFKHRFSRFVPDCPKNHELQGPIKETSKFVSIDSWEELLDSPTEVGVVRARGNWQARLAAAALSVQRGHETRIVPTHTCWSCCLALEEVPSLNKGTDDELYGPDTNVFGTLPRYFDEEGSDSETDEIVLTATKKTQDRSSEMGEESVEFEEYNRRKDFNRNTVYIL
jgi:hypothetical protein